MRLKPLLVVGGQLLVPATNHAIRQDHSLPFLSQTPLDKRPLVFREIVHADYPLESARVSIAQLRTIMSINPGPRRGIRIEDDG
jgi:hypothetical protein